MTTTPSGKPFPWTLRLVHEGFACIRAEWAGRTFVFDPYQAPQSDEQVVLTWHKPERSRGVLAAIKAGDRPRVVASAELHEWLSAAGSVQTQAPGGQVDKQVLVESMPYTPREQEQLSVKAAAAFRKPGQAARKLLSRGRQPQVDPIVVQLTFPGGERLLHLNCCLHRSTDAEWLRRAQERFGGADWVLVGMEPGEEEAVSARVAGFGAKNLLITDFVNEARAELGLPTNVLTTAVDSMKDAGLDAYPFVSGAGYRYE